MVKHLLAIDDVEDDFEDDFGADEELGDDIDLSDFMEEDFDFDDEEDDGSFVSRRSRNKK